VRVGDIWIGSRHPVVVQPMINEDTLDVEGATAGIRRLHEARYEILRLTVPSLAHAKAVKEIRQGLADTYRPGGGPSCGQGAHQSGPLRL
jgi:(E)-4-hydroxy-3-methylbut-2-enyl-diphosphate synthase